MNNNTIDFNKPILSFSPSVKILDSDVDIELAPTNEKKYNLLPIGQQKNKPHTVPAIHSQGISKKQKVTDFTVHEPNKAFSANINFIVQVEDEQEAVAVKEQRNDFWVKLLKSLEGIPVLGKALTIVLLIFSFLIIIIIYLLYDFHNLCSLHPNSAYLKEGLKCAYLIYGLAVVNFTIMHKYRVFLPFMYLLTFLAISYLSLNVFRISVIYRVCNVVVSVKESINDALISIFGDNWFGRTILGWANDMMDTDGINQCVDIIKKVDT